MGVPPLIMVVEDDAGSRELLHYIITAALPGARVVDATTVADALQLFRTLPLNVVITDYRLPDGTGIDVLQSIREVDMALPVLANSCNIDVAGQMLRAGATRFIPKPYDILQLCSWLRGLVGATAAVALQR